VLGILDFIAEIGTALPYLYRAWFWLFSSRYRAKLEDEYKRHSYSYMIFDVLMSIFFFAIECWLLFVGASYLAESYT
jgi:hypothetical protein